MVRVRFAPSPTGPLHIGGVRTALFNYVFAKKHQGTFVLRIEDTDRERSTVEFEKNITDSLKWLGIHWDEGPDCGGNFGPYRQSEKLERHRAAAKYLEDSGKAYYDSGGALRIKYNESPIVVPDIVCGDCAFDIAALGPDPVILRSDGTPTFHLAVVTDDIDMKITHVVRGQDHLTNTAKHITLFRALDAEPPKFAHLPLIMGKDGSKLSKRNAEGMTTVQDFVEKGYVPEALCNFLMLLGWSHPESKEQLSMQDAISAFDLDRVGHTGPIFETTKLDFLNGWWIRHFPFDDLAERLLGFVGEYREIIDAFGKPYWLEVVTSLHEDLSFLTDVRSWCPLLFALELAPVEDVKKIKDSRETKECFAEIISAWLKILKEAPLEPNRDRYTAEQFSQISSQLKKSNEGGKKFVFQAMRAAVTGKLSGPELKHLVPLIKREVLISRAEAMLAEFQ